MIQTLSPPLRSETNTIFFPSGLKRGAASNARPVVNAVALPPEIGIVYRSPSRSKTMVRPSGLTSTDIQLPLVAVNSALRFASRGSGLDGALGAAAPGGI